MKKILIVLLGLGILITLIGCHQVEQVKNKMEEKKQTDQDKVEDPRNLLEKLLTYIAEHNNELSFEKNQLLDTELGVPRFETVSISEIKHFDDKDIVDGFIVRPVVDVENPHLLIIVEATDKQASENVNKALGKVKSDQLEKFADAGILTKYLINNNKTVRQGNFLIYVTWEKPEEIVKVFEKHVK